MFVKRLVIPYPIDVETIIWRKVENFIRKKSQPARQGIRFLPARSGFVLTQFWVYIQRMLERASWMGKKRFETIFSMVTTAVRFSAVSRQTSCEPFSIESIYSTSRNLTQRRRHQDHRQTAVLQARSALQGQLVGRIPSYVRSGRQLHCKTIASRQLGRTMG